MPTAPHIVRCPAALGIDESTRAELLEFGAANLRQENIRQVRLGEATTRNGFAALASARVDGTTPTGGYKMFADRTTILRVTDTLQVEAYSSKAAAWSVLGRMPEVTARIIDLPSMGITTYLEDVDATNGYLAISWASIATGSGINSYLAIIDQDTGAVMRAPEKVSTNLDLAPGLLGVIGNSFVMLRYDSVGNKLNGWAIDTTSTTTLALGWVSLGAALVTDCAGSYTLHSLPHATTPRIAVLYKNTSVGTDRLTLIAVDLSGVVQTQTINTNSTNPGAFALGGTPTDTLWLAWNEATTIAVRGVQPFSFGVDNASVGYLGAMATGCNYLGIAPSATTGKARWWGNDTSTVSQSSMMGVATSGGVAIADGAQVVVPGVKMVRKPFQMTGRYFGAFFNVDTQNGQNNFFVCDWTDNLSTLRPISNAAPGLSTAGLVGQGKFVAGTVSTTIFVGFGLKRSAIAEGSAILELNFASRQRWQTCAHANATFLSAAVPSTFDGLRVAEIGFLYRPATPTTTTSGAGITALVGWRYIAVFEETDSDGNWHVSGLSNPTPNPSASVIGTGPIANKTVTVSVPPLAITSRLTSSGSSARGVRVAWYRTTDGGQAPYYRLGTTINDPSATTATYADTTTDANLISASVLYAQPGVNGTSQDRRPPPAFSAIVSYNGMLVGAAGSDVWSSAQNVSGEGAWFNPIWQVPIPGDGDITALAVMDGTLFVFKRAEVYAIAGEPPSDNAASGGLGAPRRLACDVGAISNVTCTTAVGIFFQSDRGLEVLARAQTVQWIGEPVYKTVETYPLITSMTVDPAASNSVVLIELAATDAAGLVTGAGRTLVYDLSTNKWISVDRRASSSGVVDCPSQSACVVSTVDGYRYAWMTNAGTVHYENRASYLDANGSYITPLIETAWFDSFKNEQSVWSLSVLFQQYTAAGLLVETAFDYGDYVTESNALWNDLDVRGQRQLEYRPKPRGESMKFRITSSTPDNALELSTGQGLGFFGLSLDLTAKQGPVMGTLRLDPRLRR